MILIALCIFGLLILTLIIAKVNLSFQFAKQIRILFAQSGSIAHQTFHQHKLDNLPEPVKRYFNYILKDGQSYISYVRMKHNGQFKTGIDKGWIKIQGEQYVTIQKPGFIWKGTTSMFVARDMYMSDKGRLIVSLFSCFNMIDAKGNHYDQGELLRWLGESILYPTNLLPSERLNWLPIDASTANLSYKYNGLSLFFKMTFNEIGEITEMQSKRYMDEKNLQTWVIKASDYRQLNNILIPTTFEVLWRLEKGDHSYARFNISEIEYNTPERF